MRGTQRRSRKRHAGDRAKATLTDCMNREPVKHWASQGRSTALPWRQKRSRFRARLQPRVLALDGHNELDFVGALLTLEIVGLLTDELLKRFSRELGGIFSCLFLRVAESRIEGFHFFLLVVGLFAGNRNCPGLRQIAGGLGGLLLFS